MEQINGDGKVIKKKIYQNNSTYLAYPFIVSGTDKEKLKLWNNIILEDVNNILKIYTAYVFDIFQPNTLRIGYKIKRKDEHYLSIFYRADFYSPYAAYPTQLVYTTNISLDNSRRLRLSDIIEVDSSLVDDILSWDIVIKDSDHKDNMEYLQLVRDYIGGLGKEVLHMGFESADIIGSDNYLGIYSYLTYDNIGISISVPNYLGDHVEFEQSIANLGI